MSEQREAFFPVALSPRDDASGLIDAIRAGGGRLAPPGEAQALVWTGGSAGSLRDLLAAAPGITWVQLPSAGIERYLDLIGDGRTWTAAKGTYADPVAEHALSLALAGLHRLPQAARARNWEDASGRNLQGGRVTILGGGGIGLRLIELLRPFQVRVTVVRRHPEPLEGVERVLPTRDLLDSLAGADAVVLALALTPETERIIGARELRAMKRDAWLVNVGRGKLVNTDDLVAALRDGAIGGAALDVTDPEPLPDGHPLWDLENCLITPHAANPEETQRAALAALVRENVRRRIAGERLLGLVDPELGY